MQNVSHHTNRSAEETDLSRRAAEWFALLLDDDATANDRADFRTWLESDPAHVKAYAELERLWLGSSALPEVAPPPSPTRRRVIKAGGAAVIIGTVGLGSISYLNSSRGDYRTAVGETTRITLPDGSVAELSTATAISVDFTASRRAVQLHEGEAYFTVSADAQRPFTVVAGALETTALGTQFSVAIHDNAISVAVAEHSVRVTSPFEKQDVFEGQSILFADNRLSMPTETDVGSQLSWRDGKLVFISTPFEHAVASLAKWRRGKIIVMDKALARRPVSIIVDIRRAGKILETLENGLPIRIDTYSPWLTLIYPR
ncbi:DUF4880 domain-containing protein [Rhizobiales bacterium RZME27]|jgi:transmembrane sensor|uniref:DUF4880 domain-containing protein n=1 Tax=Endobacterium cereale TaxID=2663029 RepID=A0A6A8ADK9_9HYPH|nr:FecR family protein [Endobacterium cereale]MEB2847832.1 FecR family protein [Endobacterium cereale]MQY46831.1 DUF4880 domain-containing protein [Endobacterium cereale]